MRILQIRFKNLNSLAGEWEIDLTHPAFASDGIFAITGPTGAGKTTILDAICLALYGRTPRLNKVSKGWNEIMSRQTGECFAEVTFETQAGRFRCHWSQHRARKKPGGELQPPKHEIAHADSGQIVETKARGVAEQIEAATGMDFERFTRSMLLAQGGFAVFLQAAPDERAPILEQITGTEIYSQISVRVHERRSAERKKLDTLQAELAGMQLLSAEDERQLLAGLTQKNLVDAELQRQIDLQNQAIAWLDGIGKLEQELAHVGDLKQDWQTRQQAFAPQRDKLQRATLALELTGEHAGLVALRREQQTDRQNHGECLQALPAQQAERQRREEALRLAGEDFERNKAEQRDALPVLRQVRELDLKLQEKAAPLQAAVEVIFAQETALASLRSKHNADYLSLGDMQQALAEVLKQLAETQIDEALVEHLAGIRGRFEALKNLAAQQRAKLAELDAARTQATETVQLWNTQTANLQQRQSELEAVQNALGQKQLELNNTLGSRELADWRNGLSVLKERDALLDKAGAAVRSLAESRRSVDELGSRHAALANVRTELSGQLQAQIEKHAFLEREMRLLETQLVLLQKIQGFEQFRQQLQDGEPCPLCGATEHPFAAGNIPVPDETTAVLDKVRVELKSANGAIAGLQVKQAETAKDLEQIAVRTQECTDSIAAAETLINQSCVELSIELAGQDLAAVLPRLQQDNAEQLKSAAGVVQAAEALEKQLATLRDAVANTKDAVVQVERETQDAAHRKDTAQQTLERVAQEADALAVQVQKTQFEVQQEVTVYGIDKLAADNLEQTLLALTARRDQWLARQKARVELEQQIAALEILTSHQQAQIATAEAEFIKFRAQLDSLQLEKQALNNERLALFGDKNADTEELRLSAAIETTEKQLEASRQLLNAAVQELGKLQNQVEQLQNSLAKREGRINIAAGTFLTRLGSFGFADESEYLAACLPEEQRHRLLHEAQMLDHELTELEAKQRDLVTQLESERQKSITGQPREELEQALAGLVNSHKQLLQEIGAIRQKLDDNAGLRQKQQQRVQAIDAQKREAARWDMLHELIGSADGKKYRNFAQGLTFEMMVGHANRQLQKMSDRYLLVRDAAQPLELNVLDNYQAGEIRSTKNLSGGESFIVSLALALGLSQMASKNVRVDSLFLDEGFGTLDEEALETALETLAGLQQDGKLIGVISHVAALKERIATQIQVTPLTGGRSAISGPGCGRPSRMEEA